MGAGAYFFRVNRWPAVFILAKIPWGFGGEAPISRAEARMRAGEIKACGRMPAPKD